MCLIIDANVFAEFFTDSEFSPALKWIREGEGKAIMGGSKYQKELEKVNSVFKIFGQLRTAGRLVRVDDAVIDAKEAEIENNSNLHSDDPHVIALVVESCCKVVCTKDGPLQQDFGDKFREKFGVRKPSVYKRKQHANLLCKKNIVGICK